MSIQSIISNRRQKVVLKKEKKKKAVFKENRIPTNFDNCTSVWIFSRAYSVYKIDGLQKRTLRFFMMILTLPRRVSCKHRKFAIDV